MVQNPSSCAALMVDRGRPTKCGRRDKVMAVISLRRGEKHRRWNTFDVPIFFFGWCPMFLVNFVCDFVERRGEKPSASTRVRI